jgi:acyl-CoA reductase-like NAD-dependent aldehyde dehydrogenase
MRSRRVGTTSPGRSRSSRQAAEGLRLEAERAAFTFRVAAEEAKRNYGEIVPLDWLPGNDGRVAHVRRVPFGPVAGITPFNFPLNLVSHKVAPRSPQATRSCCGRRARRR